MWDIPIQWSSCFKSTSHICYYLNELVASLSCDIKESNVNILCFIVRFESIYIDVETSHPDVYQVWLGGGGNVISHFFSTFNSTFASAQNDLERPDAVCTQLSFASLLRQGGGDVAKPQLNLLRLPGGHGSYGQQILWAVYLFNSTSLSCGPVKIIMRIRIWIY